MDDTVRRNVAFGEQDSEISDDSLSDVADIHYLKQIKNFILQREDEDEI